MSTPGRGLAVLMAVGLALPDAGASPRSLPEERDGVAPRHDEASAVVARARSYVGARYRGDCSGFVRRVFRETGRPLAIPVGLKTRSMSEMLYRATRRVDSAQPGDLAFFHNTYDR